MTVQRATWMVERCSWLALSAIILLALLGLFSNGPLSSARATDANGRFEAEYERFQRFGAPTTLQLRVAPVAGGEATVLAGSTFIKAFKLEAVTPQPTEQRSGPDGIEMTFQASGSEPLTVYLVVRPDSIGLVRSAIGITGEPPVRVTQFIFP